MSTDEPLPTGWVWANLGEITVNLDGQRVPVKSEDREKRSGAYPYYGASGVIDDIDDYLFEGDCLLIAEDGANLLSRSTPIAFRASGRFWVNNHAHVVRLREGIPLGFLEHFLNSINLQFYVTGTAQPKLNQVNLNKIRCPLPPLGEQRRIVDALEELLSDLDASVAALERARANLKKYRAAVLRASVTGELTAEWRKAHPNVEAASRLLDRVLAERRRKWESEQETKFAASGKELPKNWRNNYEPPKASQRSGLGELPTGWCWANVSQVGEVQLGRQRSPKHESKLYPTKYLRAANITEKGLSLEDVLEMEFSPAERASFGLKPGDIVVSEASGSPDQVGKPAVWRNELPGCCFQNTVIRLRPEQVSTEYLLLLFRHYYFNKVFARVAAGVGINHLSANKFSALPVPLPPQAEQDIIVSEVEQRLAAATATDDLISLSLKRSARLRQSILKEAFSGRLVPQDPNDEPASVLLDRIRQTRHDANETVAVSRPRVSRKKAR